MFWASIIVGLGMMISSLFIGAFIMGGIDRIIKAFAKRKN
jgi:hypothetical protein